MQWYGQVLRKDDEEWVKNMLFWRLKKLDKDRITWKEVVDKAMNDLHIKTRARDAIDHN